MTRAALLAAGLLTLAACSSDSDAEPPPPLETEAPITTVEPPPTEAPETTTTDAPETTTTSSVETTTTVATTEPPSTDPTEATAPSVDDPVFAEAFEAYQVAWRARRAAVANPSDEGLRDELASYYSETAFVPISEFLDRLAASDLQAEPNEDNPSRVELIRGEALTADGGVAGITVCEVLTDIGVDRATGEVVRTQIDAYRNQVFMQRSDDTWVIDVETTLTQFPEQDDCE